MPPNHPPAGADKPKENEHPTPDLNRDRRRLTKEGPPSRAELEERKRMIDEYKKAREERRRAVFAGKKVRKVISLDTVDGKPVDVLELDPVQDPVDDNLTSEIEKEPLGERPDEAAMIADYEKKEGGEMMIALFDEKAVERLDEMVAKPVGELESTFADEDNKPANDLEMENATGATVEPMEVESKERIEDPSYVADVKEELNTLTLKSMACEEEIAFSSKIQVTAPREERTFKPPPGMSWRDNAFWLSNRVFLQYHCKALDTVVITQVPMPHLRLFSVGQAEKQLACGQKELAEAMISVMRAPGQLPCNDASKHSKRLASLLARLAAGSSTDVLMAEESPLVEPTLALPALGHFSGSDSEADETGSRLAQDVDEASRRHSMILGDLMPATPSRKAGQMLMEDGGSLMASLQKRLLARSEQVKRRRVDIDLTAADDEELCGSTVKYALLTPSKRIKEMLHTELVVSPVRRSLRLADEEEDSGQLFNDLGGAVDAATGDKEDVGYLPNNTLNK